MAITSSGGRGAAAGLFLALALAACGPRAQQQIGIPPCEAVPPAFDQQATLVSPAPPATGVATTVGTVSFTVSDAALKQGATFTLTGPNVDFSTKQITTAPNGVMSVTIPALSAHGMYNASVGAPLPPERQMPCKTFIVGYLGYFTTQ